MRTPLVPLTLAGTLLLGGCAAFSEPAATEDGDLRVAGAFYPLAYVAERVAGDLAVVENLTTPGAEPHDLELTVRQSAALAEADVVVHLRDFQPAVEAAIEQNARGSVLDVSDAVELRPVAAEESQEEGHEHGDEHEHAEEGGVDPHFWLDPLLMAELGDAVAAELTAADEENASTYAENAEALRRDLEALDKEYADGLASCERDTVVVSHDAFGYLGRYGLHFDAVAGLSPDAEPTPADLAELQDIIREEGVTTVFTERLVSPRLTRTLAEDLGLGTGVLDPLEGLAEETAQEDYLSLMRQNLAALEEANGCR